MLLENRSSDVFSMLWRVRKTLVSWANSSVGIQFCSTRLVLPDPAVRPDPTRPWFVRVLDSTGFTIVRLLKIYHRDEKRVFFLAADQ